MGEKIIGADKEAVIVCYHREGGYASYRKVQGGLAPPSRVLINPECETRLRIVRREQKRSQRLHEAAAHQRRPVTQQEREEQGPGCTVHCQTGEAAVRRLLQQRSLSH